MALGDKYAVRIQPCNPVMWVESSAEAKTQGHAYAGNGFCWQPAILELLEDKVESFWFSTTPDVPGGSTWDASPFCRTGVEARFRHRATGHVLHCISFHFDHVGEEARVQSAKLLMERAHRAHAPGVTVLVGGNCNTFPDCFGPETYLALHEAGAAAGMVDIRAVPGAEELDFGVGGSSWKGWQGCEWSRGWNLERHSQDLDHDASRFDHIFVQQDAAVARTGVVEEEVWAAASDHVPIVAELRLPKRT
jgi:endonuclease/exonuclease/phosphatase family metal-dependent hydrolase